MRSPRRPAAVTVSVTAWPGGGVDCGMKLRVEENGPATPSEFRARTRHHNCWAGRPLRVACDAVSVGFAVVEPTGTVTLPGTTATLLLLDNVTTAPSAGADPLSVTSLATTRLQSRSTE